MVAATLCFKFYVENFGKYNATFGGIGAVLVLMIWFFILGHAVLLGARINALMDRH